MTAFYNEREPYAAAWLRNLIDAGHIAPGVVDERSIVDIHPEELAGYTQCHFFAGVGIWSLALRAAGWPDEMAVFSGSCPCQPFSAAGQQKGMNDERHLWPAWYKLIDYWRPPVVFGEQVSSSEVIGASAKSARPKAEGENPKWFDLVSSDLERASYSVAAANIPAAGFGVEWEESDAGQWLRRAIHDCTDSRLAAKLRDFADWAGAGNLGVGGSHIRQRLYFVGVADGHSELHDGTGFRGARGRIEYPDGSPIISMALSNSGQRGGITGGGITGGEGRIGDRTQTGRQQGDGGAESGGTVGSMDHHYHQGPQGHAGDGGAAGRQGPERPVTEAGVFGGLADCDGAGSLDGVNSEDRWEAGTVAEHSSHLQRTNAPHSSRGSLDWLFCRDERWRAVGPGAFPLAHGASSRVGRLRAYGNGLDAETATGFISAVIDVLASDDLTFTQKETNE